MMRLVKTFFENNIFNCFSSFGKFAFARTKFSHAVTKEKGRFFLTYKILITLSLYGVIL